MKRYMLTAIILICFSKGMLGKTTPYLVEYDSPTAPTKIYMHIAGDVLVGPTTSFYVVKISSWEAVLTNTYWKSGGIVKSSMTDSGKLYIQSIQFPDGSVQSSAVYGDMLKLVYDTDNDGIVDNSEKLNNQSAGYYLSCSSAVITYLNIDAQASDADKLDGLDSAGYQLYLTTSTWSAFNSERFGGQLPVYYLSVSSAVSTYLQLSSAAATYLNINAKAKDSDKLDGLDSSAYQMNLATPTWTANSANSVLNGVYTNADNNLTGYNTFDQIQCSSLTVTGDGVILTATATYAQNAGLLRGYSPADFIPSSASGYVAKSGDIMTGRLMVKPDVLVNCTTTLNIFSDGDIAHLRILNGDSYPQWAGISGANIYHAVMGDSFYGSYSEGMYKVKSDIFYSSISSVTVAGNFFCGPFGEHPLPAYIGIRVNGTSYFSSSFTVSSVYQGSDWLSFTWSTNPATGLPWTSNDIRNLQIGAKLYATGGPTYSCCFMLYGYVTGTPVTLNANGLIYSSTGYMFPDGTFQATAANNQASLTLNQTFTGFNTFSAPINFTSSMTTTGRATFTSTVDIAGDINNAPQTGPLSNITSLMTMSSTATASTPYGVKVSGRNVYVICAGANNLQVFNAENPSIVTLISSVTTGAYPVEIEIKGKYAYVLCQNDSILQVFDISNPRNIILVGQTSTCYRPSRLSIFASTAYTISPSSNTLESYNISRPSIISKQGKIFTDTNPVSLKAYKNLVYVICYTSNTLQIFNALDPSALSVISSTPIWVCGTDINVQGQYAYITRRYSVSPPTPLTIYDVSNSSSPVLVGTPTYDSYNKCDRVTPFGRYIFTSGGAVLGRRIRMYDMASLASPASPPIVGSIDFASTPGGLVSFDVSGKFIYATVSDKNVLTVINITGLETLSVNASAIETSNLRVRGSISAQDEINANFISAGDDGISSGGKIVSNNGLEVYGLVKATGISSGILFNDGSLQMTAAINTGDMLRAVYDTDHSSVVDNAEKLNGQSADYYLSCSSAEITYLHINGKAADSNKLNGLESQSFQLNLSTPVWQAADAALLQGHDSDYFQKKLSTDSWKSHDSDLLDSHNYDYFLSTTEAASTYLVKSSATVTYLHATAQAVDSQRLNGNLSNYYLSASSAVQTYLTLSSATVSYLHTGVIVPDADMLDGKHSIEYQINLSTPSWRAYDSGLLEGQSSSAFQKELSTPTWTAANASSLQGYDSTYFLSKSSAISTYLQLSSAAITYLYVDAQAKDSDMVDGKHASDFLQGFDTSTWKAYDTFNFNGKPIGFFLSTATAADLYLTQSSATITYLQKDEKASDALKLNGQAGSYYVSASSVSETYLYKQETAQDSSRLNGQLSDYYISVSSAQSIYLTQSSATLTYLHIGVKITDADNLDGLDSTAFQLNLSTSSWTAYNSTLFNGNDSSFYQVNLDTPSWTAFDSTNLNGKPYDFFLSTANAADLYLAKSSATITYLHKTEKASDTDLLNGQNASYFQVNLNTSTWTSNNALNLNGEPIGFFLSTATATDLYLTQSSATATYLYANGKAVDADKLDGKESDNFQINLATPTWRAADSALLEGHSSDYYLSVSSISDIYLTQSSATATYLNKEATASDSLKLNGQPSDYYISASSVSGTYLYKEEIAKNTERLNGQLSDYYLSVSSAESVYLTQSSAAVTYMHIGIQVSDADKLDGLDADAFQVNLTTPTWQAADAALLEGYNSAYFQKYLSTDSWTANNSDQLDGYHYDAFFSTRGGNINGNVTIEGNIDTKANAVFISSAIVGVTRIEWADGTVQVSSPFYSSGGSGSVIADNLGNHIATTTLTMNGNWISGDYDAEGIFIKPNGNVGINTNDPLYKLDIAGQLNTGNYAIFNSSAIIGVKEIRWANGTVQISSPIAGSGGGSSCLWTTGIGDDIYKSTGNVGVGITNPACKLDVYGMINSSYAYAINGIRMLWNPANRDDNVALGRENGKDITTASNSTLIGRRAGWKITTGSNNTFIGYLSGYMNSTGYGNTFLGAEAGSTNYYGTFNTCLGAFSGEGIINGSSNENVILGYLAGYTTSLGSNNLFLGSRSGFSNTGANNVFVGHSAGYNETGSNKLYIENTNSSTPLIWGDFSNDVVNINGKLSVGTTTPVYPLDIYGFIRSTAGFVCPDGTIITSTSTFGGSSGGIASGDNLGNHVATTTLKMNGNWVSGDGDSEGVYVANNGNVGIFTNSPAQRLDVYGVINTTVSYYMRNKEMFSTSGSMNVFIGEEACKSRADGMQRVTAVGYKAGWSSYGGTQNVFIGNHSGFSVIGGNNNTFVGTQSGDNVTGGIENVCMGTFSGEGIYNSNANTLLGYKAGGNGTLGNDNVMVGDQTGVFCNGAGNIFLGTKAGYNETGSNKLYIENTNSATPLIWGDFSSDIVNINGKLSVGTTAPVYPLDIYGFIRSTAGFVCPDGTVITSTSPFGGNGGTGSVIVDNLGNHIATTTLTMNGNWISGDSDAEGIFIKNDGNVGINTNNPQYKLDIEGQVNTGNFAVFTSSAIIGVKEIRWANGTVQVSSPVASVGGSSTGDNLGSHVATTTLKMNGNWVSGDGDTEGVFVANNGNVGIFTNNPTQRLDVYGVINTTVSYYIGNKEMFSTAGTMNVFIGEEADKSRGSGTQRITAIGYRAGWSNSGGSQNVFIGNSAGSSNNSGGNNVFIGTQCGDYNTSGSENVCMGTFTGEGIYTSNTNTLLGYRVAGSGTLGSENVMIGGRAGMMCNGTGNVFLGARSGYNETGSNKLYIENTNSATPLIWGDFSNDIVTINGKLGIGTTSPVYAFDTYGFIRSTAGFVCPDNTVIISSGSFNPKLNYVAETVPGVFVSTNLIVGAGVTPTDYLLTMAGGGYYDSGDGQWHNYCKKTIKADISDSDIDVISKLKLLKVRKYKYKREKTKLGDKAPYHIGFIADEADQILTGIGKDSMATGDCIGFLLAVVKEQQKRMEILDLKITNDREKISTLEKEVTKLKKVPQAQASVAQRSSVLEATVSEKIVSKSKAVLKAVADAIKK